MAGFANTLFRKGQSMSHIVAHDGKMFRVEILQLAHPTDPKQAVYMGQCSGAFDDYSQLPTLGFSKFIPGTLWLEYAVALKYACDWIRMNWDAEKSKRQFAVGDQVGHTKTNRVGTIKALVPGSINVPQVLVGFTDGANEDVRTSELVFVPYL